MKDIKPHIVKRNLATAAKVLGYDIPSRWYYHAKESNTYQKHKRYRGLCYSRHNAITNTGSWTISAPIQTLLRDWIWKKHKIFVTVGVYEDGFGYTIKQDIGGYIKLVDYTAKRNYSSVKESNKHETPISAMEEGLIAAINYINKEIKKDITYEN